MQKITSRENAKLKLARKARDGRAGDLIFIEGVRLAEEARRSGISIREVFVAENFALNPRTADLLESFRAADLSFSEVPENLFNSIADTKSSQGIILVCAKPATRKNDFETRFSLNGKLPVVVLLHEVNNPSNLGAILRTAEAVNVAGVITTKNSADAFAPKSLRASMGAALRLNVWEDAEFAEALSWAGGKDLVSTAADIKAAKIYTDLDWRVPRLLVFGSEAHGLNEEDFRMLDEGLIIPMENGVESLNLAVSCGIILFEAKRQTEKNA